jgi:16S rRNA (guanine527-N7)-methyltransferase
VRKTLKIPIVDNSEFESRIQAYHQLVSNWNSITNLISTRAVDNLLTSLIPQSLAPLKAISVPKNARVLDVGSGAGLPGLPMKFARPDLRVTLLEPNRKKWLFLRSVISELKLEGVDALRGRVEDLRKEARYQAAFDLITARGTGSAMKLLTDMTPLVAEGGICCFYKGKTANAEAEEIARSTNHLIQIHPISKTLQLLCVEFHERTK